MQRIEFKNLPDQTTPLSAQKLNQLQTNVENGIADAKEFSLLGAVSGSTSLALPSSYDELVIVIVIDSNQNICFSITIPKGELTTTRGYNGGYYSSSSTNARYRVTATSTSLNLSTAVLNGSDVLSNSVMRVYYR